MPRFRPFALERWMSRWEQTVELNLAESGVHPLTLGELLELAPEAHHALFETSLGYPHVNGDPLLRERIAALYPGASPENVLVTVGAAEANYLVAETLLGPGEAAAVMLPNYMQLPGAGENRGAELRPFRLCQERGWSVDTDELARACEGARLLAVCHPNNPTGHALTASEREAIANAASRAGAWLLSDEVYRGAERATDIETPSMWGTCERAIAVGGLSKAYGLPGLRIGWVVAPRELVDELWARHEYTTISASSLSNRLAAVALAPEVRPRLLARARAYVRRGWTVFERFLSERPGLLAATPPDASAIVFARYAAEIPSAELAERLRLEKSLLVVPGEHFGIERHLRLTFGVPEETLTRAMGRLAEVLAA